MKNRLIPVILSAIAVVYGDTCFALPYSLERYPLATGEVIRVPLSLTQRGGYTLSVSTNAGDADIYVYRPNGEQIGVGNQIGNDSLSGDLAPGMYTVSIYMASCRSASGSCTANFSVSSTDGNR
ncbi:MAG: hypothetical protein AB8B99_22745 [Phormidesmis sp.]